MSANRITLFGICLQPRSAYRDVAQIAKQVLQAQTFMRREKKLGNKKVSREENNVLLFL